MSGRLRPAQIADVIQAQPGFVRGHHDHTAKAELWLPSARYCSGLQFRWWLVSHSPRSWLTASTAVTKRAEAARVERNAMVACARDALKDTTYQSRDLIDFQTLERPRRATHGPSAPSECRSPCSRPKPL